MKNLFFLFLFIFHFGFSQTTTFFRTYGEFPKSSNAVALTSDGGYIVTGKYFPGEGGYDIFILKADSLGDEIWTRTYGTVQFDEAFDIQETFDGGYIIAGHTGEPDSLDGFLSDIFVLKTNSEGDSIWSFTWNPGRIDRAYDLAQTTDSSYIVAGIVQLPGGPGEGMSFLAKINNVGDTLWTKIYRAPNNAYRVIQTLDGGMLFSTGTSYAQDIYLVKTDATGDTLWTKAYTQGEDHFGIGNIIQTPDSSFIAVGTLFDGDASDAIITKLDPSGNTVWTKSYGGNLFDYANDLDVTPNGELIITGSYQHGSSGTSTNQDIWLLKTDQNGDSLWTRTYGGASSENGASIKSCPDGGLVITGYTSTLNSIFILKTDSLGNAPLLTFVNAPSTIPGIHINLYPNPTDELLHIDFELTQAVDNVQCSITDKVGRVFHNFKKRHFPQGKNEFNLDVNQLQPGIYFLNITILGATQVKRFLKL